MKNHKYTVIGFWSDNHQPWIHFGVGPDPVTGAANAIDEFLRSQDEYEPGYLDNLMIVEVIQGHHKGTFPSDKAISAKSLLEYITPTGVKEWRPE